MLGIGVRPNQVTVLGSIVVSLGAIFWLARGVMIPGAVMVACALWVDPIDGLMARIGDTVTQLGAFLDSVLDRVVDAAIYSSLAWWLFSVGQWRAAAVAMSCIATTSLVPYVRARAESLGLRGQTGFAHRFNRLRITAAGVFVTGVSTPICLEITLWVLTVSAALTVVQRLMLVARSGGAAQPAAPEQSGSERHHTGRVGP